MTVIVTKNSSTASAVPTTSDLVQGELAVNVTDKRIFTENASTQIVELGTNPSTVTTATATVTGTLTANGTFASSNAVVTGGTINSTPIGATTPSTVKGTTVTATTGFVGGLTGNVVGNVTGNVTGNVVGNVTGDLTGNVTASSGTSTVNNLVVNGTVDFSNTRLTDVAEPVAGSDAATKTYVDTSIAAVIDGAPAALDTLNELAAALNDDASFHTTVTNALTGKLALSGGTMTGQLSLGANKIVSVADPTLAQDVATKAYVDAADSTGLPLSGGTMSGVIAMGTNKITGLGDPTLAQDAATKAYTDSILGSATSAADSAAAAATSASNASTSASNAASSATTASNAVTSAELAATNAAASYDSFDDRYLGAKASDPTLDNDGDALIAGATYFNTSTDSMKVYSGSAWSDVAPVATTVTLSQVTDFPSQSGQSGKYLSTNGTTPTWETLTTDPTLGTLTKTFTTGEASIINLTSSVLAPVVSVTKEVPQSGVTNNNWDVNSTTENYTRLNSAPATTLDWVGFDVSTAAYNSVSFSVASQDTAPQGIAFNTDGTKMFVVGASGDDVNEYALSTGFDVSTASFVDSFSVSAQDTNPTGIAFNSDGTKMFVCGYIGQDVNEYTLSTGFDVSTATFVDSFSISAQDTVVHGIAFNIDGTKMFIVGDSGNNVYEYTLSTGFDVSTSTYSQSFSVSSQTTAPSEIAFNSNGTKMFVLGSGAVDAVYEYTLSTGFDVSTASFVDSFSVTSQETSPFGLAFSTDGSKMFISGFGTDSIFQYSMATTLALGTGSFASADVGKTIEANDGAFVLTATDGSYVETTAPTSYDQVASGSWEMYGVVYNAADGDLELSGASVNTFDVSTAVYSQSFSVAAQDTVPQEIAFSADGAKMFILGETGQDVNEYTLSSNFDVSTASFVDSFSVSAQETGPTGLSFNNDGTKMFVIGTTGDDVNEYTLSSGFDVSTASFVDSFSVSGQETTPQAIAFNADGTKMFVLGFLSVGVNEYTLSVGFDVSTATYSQVFSVSAQESGPRGLAFNTTGTKMFVVGTTGGDVNEYTLSVGFDVSTASFVDSFSVSAQDGVPRGITFNTGGTKMFIVGSSSDSVHEYSIGSTAAPTGYHPVHTTASIDSTYWTDINSMTADQAAGDGNVYYAISTDDRTTWTVIDNTDGERDIVRNNAGTWQYNSNGTYASETWVNGATNTELATLAEAMEGASSVVNPFNLASVTYSQSFSVTSQDTDPRGIAFNSLGTKMFVVGGTGDDVNEYNLSTGFDVSTASFVTSFSISAQATEPTGIAFNTDGTKMFVQDNSADTVSEYTLSTGFDVSTASFSQSFSTAAEVLVPWGLAFNTDGTKMFVADLSADDVSEYALSIGFDVSTASYSQNFSTSAQGTFTTGVSFNTSGTKMFVIAGSINQYTLSTGFDVSTASYDNVSYSVAAQDGSPYGIAFNTDGSKMFIVGANNDNVYEYNLPLSSLALGTGSFASADVGKTIEANSGAFVLTATSGSYVETTAPTSYAQVASGSWEMYGVVYNAADGDLELSSLIVGFDISSASFVDSFLMSAQDATVQGIAFNNDGTKMFMVGDQNNSVFEYSLSIAFDITTASFVSSFSVGGFESSPRDIAFNTDGTKMYVIGTAGDSVRIFILSTGFDITTATYSSNFSVSTQDASPEGIKFNSDGTKMFVVGDQYNSVYEYDLSTGFDVSTASYSQSFSVSSQAGEPSGIAFNNDGTKMFIVDYGNRNVFQYTLTTGFDISTASYSSISFSVLSQATGPRGIVFNTDGSKMFVSGQNSDSVHQYSTFILTVPTGYHPVHTTNSIDSTYWTDINSMTADQAAGDGNVYYAISTDDRTTWTVIDNTDGERDIVRNNAGTWQYNSNATYASETWVNGTTNTELATLAEAMDAVSNIIGQFDVSTAAFVQSLSVVSQDGTPTDITFNDDGSKMFIVGRSTPSVYEYALSTNFDISSSTYTQNFSVSSQESEPMGLTFNNDGTRMYVLGRNTGQAVYEYTLSTGFDVSTASYSQSASVAAQDSSPSAVRFNSNGSKMFVLGVGNDSVYEYTLTTNFNVSSASYSQLFSVASQDTVPQGLAFSSDGTKMFVAGFSGKDVNEYTLSTGFDISTASFVDSFSVSSQETDPQGVAFDTNGTKMYVVGTSSQDVNQYSIGSTDYTNQMDKTQLDAVTDPNHIALGDDLDLAIVFNMTSGATVPSSDGVAINYDANVLNKGAVLGTDYDFDAPTQNSVRITALAGNNLKVRVV